MTSHQISLLHTYARELTEEFRAMGAVFEKKYLRYNDLVAVGMHYAKLGEVTSSTFSTAKAGVREALSACVKVWVTDRGPVQSPMYSDEHGPLGLIQRWMEDWRSNSADVAASGAAAPRHLPGAAASGFFRGAA